MAPSRLSSLLILALFLVAPMVFGQPVSGVVRDAGGVPLAGVSIDFSGGALPAPIVTSSTGAFSISVPAGTYDIEFIPPAGYAPRRLNAVVVSGPVNLGTVTIQQGFQLTGTVTATTGLPVAGTDLNVYDVNTGAKLFTPGDNTNLAGAFDVTVPAGTWRVRFSPPGAALLVAREIQPVSVTGPTSMGTVVLQPGVQLSGVVVNAVTLAPLVDVDIDVDVATTGQRIVTPDDDTNAFGAFSVVVPTGLFRVSYDPPPGMAVVARVRHGISVTGPTALGTVGLQPGHFLSGVVTDSAGAPVVGADIDVDTSGGSRLPTPRDKTDANGMFTVVVPSGSYDVTVEPDFAAGLVGSRIAGFSVTGSTSIPTQILQAGVVLSGTVTSPFGTGEPDCAIDVMDPMTGDDLVTPGFDTNAAGFFQIIVPNGTWDVRYRTRRASAAMDTIDAGVVVGGATVLNRMLPLLPAGFFIDTPSVPVVAPGGFLTLDTAMLNTGSTGLTVTASLVLIDPSGVETPIIAPFPFFLPPQQVIWIPNANVQIPFSVSPSALGLTYRLEGRFDDVVTGMRIDEDHFDVVVQ